MPILAENSRLRLKVMLRGPKLWVNLILNVIGVRLRFIGTHLDHNRYIIRIFIFVFFFYRSLWSHTKVSDPPPPCRGVQNFVFIHYYIVVSNPINVLEVGKKSISKFSNLSPLPTWGIELKNGMCKGEKRRHAFRRNVIFQTLLITCYNI